MKGSDSFDRRHTLFALVPFVLITLLPLVMVILTDATSAFTSLKDATTLNAFLKETAICAICAIAAVLLGFPGAHIMARYRFPLKKLVWAFCLLSLASPSSSIILSITRLKSYAGLSFPIEGMESAIALLVLNIPLVVLVIGSYWKGIEDGIMDSARTLGANRGRVFFTVTLPYLRRSILGAFALVFVRCMTESLSSIPLASLLVSLVAVMVFTCSLYGKRALTSVAVRNSAQRPSGFASHLYVLLYCLLLFALTVAGPSILAYEAFSSDAGFTFSEFKDLFLFSWSAGTEAVLAMVTCAVPSALIASFLASRLSYAVKSFRLPVFLTLIAMAMGMNLVMKGYSSFVTYTPTVPLIVYEILSDIVFLTPFAVLVTLPRSRSVDPSYRTASETLGYGAGKSYRQTEGKLLAPVHVASFLISVAIWTMKYTPFFMSDLLEKATFASNYMHDACAFAFMMTVFSFVLLLLGGRLLRKEL